MNEKQIEIALAKLRKAWIQTKTQIGKQRIEFAAKILKQGLSGSLIPLTYAESNDGSRWNGKIEHVSEIPSYSDAELHDIKHHGLVAFGSY